MEVWSFLVAIYIQARESECRAREQDDAANYHTSRTPKYKTFNYKYNNYDVRTILRLTNRALHTARIRLQPDPEENKF